MTHRLRKGRGHGGNAGNIFRAGASSALLGAALNQIRKLDSFSRIQETDALRAVEFVCGCREQINVVENDIHRNMPHRLHRIGVEQNALGAAEGSDLADGLNRADLIVCKHNRHKAGLIGDGGLHFGRLNDSVLMHRKKRDGKALRLQAF